MCSVCHLWDDKIRKETKRWQPIVLKSCAPCIILPNEFYWLHRHPRTAIAMANHKACSSLRLHLTEWLFYLSFASWIGNDGISSREKKNILQFLKLIILFWSGNYLLHWHFSTLVVMMITQTHTQRTEMQ